MIAVPRVHESFEEFEMADYSQCLIFNKYFLVAEAPDVYGKYYHRLMSKATRNYYSSASLQGKTILFVLHWQPDRD